LPQRLEPARVPLGEAARFANAVGALSVQKLGSVEGLRTYEETLEWMEEQLNAGVETA